MSGKKFLNALCVSVLGCFALLNTVGCVSKDAANPYSKKIPEEQLRMIERSKKYRDPTALSIQANVPTDETFQLEIPKDFFINDLPGRYQNKGIGIINNIEQFTKMWNLYSRDNTALMPSIDFETKALLFIYDAKHYNQIRIIKMNVQEGVADPICWHTDTTLPLQDKVFVAFLQLPRHTASRPGVTAIYANGEIVAVPSRP